MDRQATAWKMFLGLAFLVLVAAVLLSYLYGAADIAARAELKKELAKSLLYLIFVGIAAMAAKTVVDQYVAAAQRQRQDAERTEAQLRSDHALQVKALSTLTTSYWNAKKALKIIEAHRSAKSYGEQMGVVIDHRLELQQLENEIMAGMYTLRDTEQICDELAKIDKQLGLVTNEWRDRYLELAQQQVLDDNAVLTDKKVPKEIEELPAFSAVRANEFAVIHEPFERAANLIRVQVFKRTAALG